MKLTSFDDMELSYYPDTPDPLSRLSIRERMRGVLSFCRSYAENFSTSSSSLLMRGATGTGKTHVSLAIAKIAAEQGHSVIYGPAQQLLHKIEKEHFGRSDGNSEDMMAGCDLLILDDLGMEFSSPFYVSCLYNLINTRMLADLPTIISTNLNQSQMQERYGDAITSRITGSFNPIVFLGKDIRQIKSQQRMS
jgi:DNA replication protein DnaC